MSIKNNSALRLPNIKQSYQALIKETLQHFHEPQWLGENSFWAAPYLLGQWLQNSPNDPQDDVSQRGQILQMLIKKAINAITELDDKRPLPWAHILELRYLSKEKLKISDIHERLHTSNAAEGRQHPKALDQMVVELFKLIKPSLRLEAPSNFTSLVGRQIELEQCQNELAQGRSPSLHGPSGIGKTSLGVKLAHQFAPAQFFWFTIRPGLNDHISSVVFALAYFLHQQGFRSSWMQLMADQSIVHEHTISLLRYDLEQLSSNQMLLCFDEIDLLRPSEVQAHTELVPFLASLKKIVPILFIGQKPFLESDASVPLQGLDFDAVQKMLLDGAIRLSHEQLLELHRHTQGNPRLLELYQARFHALKRSGDLVDAAMDLSDEPSVELLLRRIWHHLNKEEMHLLELAAVFQSPMPIEAWSSTNYQQAFRVLIDWRLLQSSGQGSATMLPILQETILRLLDADEKRALDLEAAEVFARYQQFTMAGHHYMAAGIPSLTIHFLQDHLMMELDQGQAFAAEQILKAITSQQLESAKEKETLRILRAKVHHALGEHDRALEDIQKSVWQVPFLKVQADHLKGDIFELRGESTRALDAYRTATETVEEWFAESSSLHRAVGYLYINEREFPLAELEVWRIRHDASNLEGSIRLSKGEVEQAESAYLDAIEYAERAEYQYGQANVSMNLGSIYGWRRDIKQAEKYLEKAIRFFETTGRTNKLAEALYNLAFARRLGSQFRDAIEPAQRSLELFTKIGRSLGRTYSMQILAEVYTGLDDFENAEHFAHQVIQDENINAYPDGLYVLGEIRLKQGNLEEAERLIRESHQIAEQNDDAILIGYTLRSLGKTLIAKREQEIGMEALTESIRIFREATMAAEAESTEQILEASMQTDGCVEEIAHT
ncbi:MAG: hypothetical protein AAF702_05115 [Chloroflexota bacterium]